MKKTITTGLLLLLPTALIFAATQVPHIRHIYHNAKDGIDIVESIPSVDSDEQDHNLTITVHGKVVRQLSYRSIDKIYRGDLDGNGLYEMIIRGYTGGAHCCFDLHIVPLEVKDPKVFSLPMANTEYIDFKDLDGDTIPEIVTWDDQYSYSFVLCFACSPTIKVIADYADGRLKLRPRLMERLTQPDLSRLKPSSISLEADGSAGASEGASDVISAMLHYFYIGKKAKAIEIMHRYLRFDHPAVKSIFLRDLFALMARSPYWDQIRRINHWYERNGHEEWLWDVYLVRAEVFAAAGMQSAQIK